MNKNKILHKFKYLALLLTEISNKTNNVKKELFEIKKILNELYLELEKK